MDQQTIYNYIQKFLVGISQLKEQEVRKAYQGKPTPLPEQGDSLLAFFISNVKSDGMWRSSSLEEYTAREIQTVSIVCYGNESRRISDRICYSCMYSEMLSKYLPTNIRVQSCTPRITSPVLINNIWVQRTDFDMILSVVIEENLSEQDYFNIEDIEVEIISK